jgi:hypothetical protein
MIVFSFVFALSSVPSIEDFESAHQLQRVRSVGAGQIQCGAASEFDLEPRAISLNRRSSISGRAAIGVSIR